MQGGPAEATSIDLVRLFLEAPKAILHVETRSNLAISAESACLPTTVAVARHQHIYRPRVWLPAVCCSVLIENARACELGQMAFLWSPEHNEMSNI